jgi:hypothetical protein
MSLPVLAEVSSLPGKVAEELERVVAARERYRVYLRDMPVAAAAAARIGFFVDVMTIAIEAAKRAIAEGDAVAMIHALRQLEACADA